MLITKLDTVTYNSTKNLLGGPTILFVEEDIPEIEMICDENGLPTKGGRIGYALAHCMMAGLVAYIFWAL